MGTSSDKITPLDAAQSDMGRVEAGFTLVELLVTVAVMTIVVGAIGAGIITSLKNQKAVAAQVSDSSNGQITSAVYVRDVQSATLITTSVSASSPSPCGTGPGTFLLGLTFGDPYVAVVSYWDDSTAGYLLRTYCTTTSSTPTSTVRITLGVSSSSAVQVAVVPPVPPAGWTTAAGISSISLGTLEPSSTYQFNLLAAPRLSTPQSLKVPQGGNPAPPPLFLLGNTAPVLDCSGSKTTTINVNGAAFIDSPSGSTVQMNGNGSLSASQVYTNAQPPSSAISPSSPAGSYKAPAPIYVPHSNDPYATLIPPDPVALGLPVFNSVNDPSGTYMGPGDYKVKLTFGSKTTTVMATGTYYLEAGITVTGQAVVSSAVGGVLLYVAGGQVDFGGQGNVTLGPLTPPPYPATSTSPGAPNLLIWQAASDSLPLNLAGNASGNIYSGTIYAPSAQIGASGNAGFTAGSVVASSISCSGNGIDTIG